MVKTVRNFPQLKCYASEWNVLGSIALASVVLHVTMSFSLLLLVCCVAWLKLLLTHAAEREGP